MARLCGAALGFFAFAATVFLGLSAGNPVEVTLKRAMQAMFLFFGLGLCVGWVACRVIDEHTLSRHRELFPDEGEGSSDEEEPGPDEASARATGPVDEGIPTRIAS